MQFIFKNKQTSFAFLIHIFLSFENFSLSLEIALKDGHQHTAKSDA